MNHPASRSPKSRAFSLIELLAVMGVVAVMSALVVPAFNGIKGGRDLTNTAYEIATALEQARAYAMANNTYVFVGIEELDASQPDSASQSSGTGRVVIAAAASRDGTRTYTASADNLRAVAKLRKFDNVHIADAVANSGALERPSVGSTNRVGNSAFRAEQPFSWPIGGAARYTFNKIIQFDPRGVASVQTSDPYESARWMEIALLKSYGVTVVSDGRSGNLAAVQLDGVTGAVRVYRP